jgi:magnesium chelatase family protein
MQLAVVYSRTNQGIDAPLVSVEVHISNGLPSLSIVGLPATAVKESKDRVRAALLNARFKFPDGRITVNLAPADIPKDGGRFDLPIAIGILAASNQIPHLSLSEYEFVGELSLGGALREVKGILPTAYATQSAQRQLVVPVENAEEAALIDSLNVFAIDHLSTISSHLQNINICLPYQSHKTFCEPEYSVDLADVKGQFQARRALEISAVGGHHMLMIGPPGTGKTMLARRLATILPKMSESEALETATIASISQQGFQVEHWRQRPVRDPHHTCSGVALAGGGIKAKPGEVSLAHQGILFLDELTEFNRHVLDVLREPLETQQISISRVAQQATYPANFQLIAAMNPCPQGYACDFKQNCHCSVQQQQRHRAKLSAPFLDRIDLQIEVPRLSQKDLMSSQRGESSQRVRERVLQARERQLKRQGKINTHLNPQDIEKYCSLSQTDNRLLFTALERFKLSARAYHRILKVARSIADLADCESIKTMHITEALSYRCMERLLVSQEHNIASM